ncbi:MAG: hypoxanthine-guanine phosphoribosyltransferase [Gammaproteobacteria bacterium]|nr:MAG: hypoxanthine-guanine phosphoribosyltransferase [Gammaproteobacteria bacterium]
MSKYKELAKEAEEVAREADLLIAPEQIESAVDFLAARLNRDLAGKVPLVLAVMSGGAVLFGKLLTKLNIVLNVDYLHATRYQNETVGSEINWKVKPQTDIKGRTVVVVDDILDEGNTLAAITDYCRENGANEVFSVVLVDKKHERKYNEIKADYVGLEVEDRYIFGEGMDYKGFLRNLSGIYALKEG